MKLRKFDGYLYERLHDPEFAVADVKTAFEDGGIEDFLYAIREVAIAQGGVQKVAAESRHGRESLYKSLSTQGNPRVKTLEDVLHVLGMRLTVTRAADSTPQKQTPVAASV